jgi:hypothetical protein
MFRNLRFVFQGGTDLGVAGRVKHLAPLLAAPAVLVLTQGRAEAILNINIFQSGADVVVRTSGSLGSLPNPLYSGNCSFNNGAYESSNELICTGPSNNINAYLISSPSGIPGTVDYLGADSSSGSSVAFQSRPDLNLFRLFLEPSFSGGEIFSESIYYNKTLSTDFGILTAGLFGTWSLQPANGSDPYIANEKINLIVGPPSVPGPLPLFGTAAALAWSRQLRRRITSPSITSPQV